MLGTPISEVTIKKGDKVRDYVVKKKLGEGSCGMVYLVENKKGMAAMKVEPRMKDPEDEILKMEIFVLKKLQKSKHVAKFLCSGLEKRFTYVIMSVLGKEVEDVRRMQDGRRLSTASSLRILIQMVKGLQDVHEAGFIHRDVKASNVAFGLDKARHAIFIFDFGLARQIFIIRNGKWTLRDARKRVAFRGTVRYCSLNVHLRKDQSRHDDLWSALFSMIEVATATLPWKGMQRADAQALKMKHVEKEFHRKNALFQGVPDSFFEMAKHLRSLSYYDTPNYKQLMDKIAVDLKKTGVSMTDDWEWEKVDAKASAPLAMHVANSLIEKSDKRGATKGGEDTLRNAKVSVLTEDEPDSQADPEECNKTLENLRTKE